MKKRKYGDDKFCLKRLNIFRENMGMGPIIHIIKRCMACNHKFESEGDHNRLCRLCRLRDSEGL